MKIIVFTTDMPPLSGFPTSGTALRTFGLAQGLKAHGHEIIVCPPKDAVEGFLKSFEGNPEYSKVKAQVQPLKELAFDSFNQADLIRNLNPDVILCGHWPAMMLQTKPSQPVIVDLAGPYLLERYFQGDEDHKGATLAKLKVLSLADYFLVSGPSQRLYFLSYLMRAGVKRPESRIRNITMPLSPEMPQKAKPSKEYPHFLFGGVFLPWQDPSWGLKNLSDYLSKNQKGALSLVGGPHPNYPIDEGSYENLFQTICSNSRVERTGMLPYEQFASLMSSADVAFDLMDWNLERQLAVTIRTTTYLWAGLPVIYNDYADLGRLIHQYDAGWLVKPGDNEALETVLNIIYNDPQTVAKKAKNAQTLARNEFSWNRAVLPLLDLLSGDTPSGYRETDILLEHRESADIRAIKGHPIEQYFVCRVDGLCRAECTLATHNIKKITPITIRVFSIDTTPGSTPKNLSVIGKNLIIEKTIPGDKIINNEWIGLDFEPIKDSAGQVFSLQITSEESHEFAAISPWMMKASPYPLLALAYGNEKVDQMCLCLRTIGTLSSLSAVNQ